MVSIEEVQSVPGLRGLLEDGYVVSAVYSYQEITGQAIYYRVRMDHPTKGKTIRPLHHVAGDVLELGEPDSIKHGPKPLYGLPLLTRAAAHVWLVEGEKCADTLNAAFARLGVADAHIALTSGSASSADKADWQPLVGRRVTIWPDNDEAGQRYAVAAQKMLAAIGCEVALLAVDRLDLCEGEDCVEWLEADPQATLSDLLALPTLKPEPDVNMVCMAEIEMKPIEWLWEERIACGKLTVLAGNPGLGKSQLTASMAAHITRGLEWPDGSANAPLGSVIFLSAEDDAADTIVPRLNAAYADVVKCHLLEAVYTETRDGKRLARNFDLVRDVERLGQAIQALGDVKLVVIDPITAYLGETDSHNNAELRAALMPLATMAAKLGVAVLLVTHLNKSQNQDVIARVIGSIGMIAAARAGFAVVKDAQDHARRYFLPIKHNVGNDADGFAFTIETVELKGGISTSRVVWQSEMIEAHTILNPPAEAKPTATNEAADWLRELLASGPMLAASVFAEAEGAGFTRSCVQRAAKQIKVERRKQATKNGSWVWILPNQSWRRNEAREDSKDGMVLEVELSVPSS